MPTPFASHLSSILWLATISTSFAFANSSNEHAVNSNILVVGATGTTGLRAIQGLLDVGYKPHQLEIMTRDASKPKMKQLQNLGFRLIQADMQRPSSLRDIGKGCQGCYIHATGGDTKELDTSEVSSARNLCEALHKDVTCIVYNSSAASKNHGVRRIQQKHDIEHILSERKSPSHVTCLRANLFGEEIWKHYTRPSILKGVYPLPVNRWRKLYLTSVRDMGRLAGVLISKDSGDGDSMKKFRVLNVAGDRMSGSQLASAFGKAQGSACHHVNNRELTKMAKESFLELYEQIHFIQTSPEKTNIAALKREFPGLITDFDTFLQETGWGDRERSFEDLSRPETLDIVV